MLNMHLLKEWREQRQALALMLAALATIALGLGLLAPRHLVPLDVTIWFVLGATVLGLVVFGGDLVPGERRRNQLDFLARTPGALRTSFVAKWIVLTTSLATLAGTALLAGLFCDAVAGSDPTTASVGVAGTDQMPIRRSAGLDELPAGVLLWGLGLLVPWIFACSCWTRRSSSVLPITLALLAAIGLPFALGAYRYPVPLDEPQLFAGLSLAALTGVAAAWRSFVPGFRLGASRRSLRLGLTTTLLFLVPAAGWSLERIHRWHHVDPGEARLNLRSGIVSTDGRTCLVRLQRHWHRHGPGYVIRLDLETGEWTQLGLAWSNVQGCGLFSLFDNLRTPYAPQPWCTVVHASSRSGQDAREAFAMDLRSGERTPVDLDGPLLGRIAMELREAAAASPSFDLPGGGTAWIEQDQVVFVDDRGERESIPWPEGYRPVNVCGFGVQFEPRMSPRPSAARGTQMLDLTRRKFFAHNHESIFTYVRPGDWIQTDWGPGGYRKGRKARTLLLDPVAGSETELQLAERERLLGMASDGRLLLQGADDRAFLLEPASGARTSLRIGTDLLLADDEHPRQRRAQSPRTPDGREVWPLRLADTGQAFARRDGESLQVTRVDAAGEHIELFAVPDDDHVLVIRGMQSLERWRFGSDQAEVLFRVGPDRTPPP